MDVFIVTFRHDGEDRVIDSVFSDPSAARRRADAIDSDYDVPVRVSKFTLNEVEE